MHKIDLKGTWQLQRLSNGDIIPARVPGDIYSAHLGAGLIEDPFWGTNEDKVQWLRKETWTYTREFEVDPALLELPMLYLHCAVLDTLTCICLNGKLLATTENMFRRYRLEVADFLKAGTNTIAITFLPVEAYASARAKALPYSVPYSENNNKVAHFNQVRKVQCHAGWDWGICLVTAGIYRDIYIAATPAGRIEHVTTSQQHLPGKCTVTVAVEYTAAREGKEILQVTLGEERRQQEVQLTTGSNRLELSLNLCEPDLWWPRGYGAQPLYDLTVQLAGEKIQKQIGLRRVEVITKLADGSPCLYLEVNGQAVFCKGANWIPIESLPGHYSRKVYERLIKSSVTANFNMLRVWGGGQYEEDIFYQLCNQQGIMVWQDFMFACSQYPADTEFLENVRQEAVYQVKRLKDHPSIMLWCGDNEIQNAFQWYAEVRKKPELYLDNYTKLNQGVLRAVVTEHDPQRYFWSSSPGNGQDVCSDHTTDDPGRGDIHYWKVWHGGIDFSDYQKVQPHFCSEFGFQSYPSLESVKTFAPPQQWQIESEIMQWHQRCGAGNLKIRDALQKYFGLPETFAETLWLSQVMQAVSISKAVEYWRTLLPYCMGVLYWQLNDLWPVSSWSSIEYSGRWKPLHYFLRRAFSPLAAIPLAEDSGAVSIYLVNDSPATLDTHLSLKLYTFSGKLLEETSDNLAVSGMTSLKAREFMLQKEHPAPTECFLLLELRADGLSHYNVHFFTPFKDCPIQAPIIEARISIKTDSILINLSSSHPAFFVTLDSSDLAGTFSDNVFCLLPGITRQISFLPEGRMPEKGLKQKLQILSYTGGKATQTNIR